MTTNSITPGKRLKLIPFQPSVTSSNLGWSSLRLEDYRNLPPSNLQLPPLNHHIIAYHYKPPPGGLMHSCGGARNYRKLRKNDITYVPANRDNHWEFDYGNPHCLHILVSEQFFNQTALVSFNVDPATIESTGTIQLQEPRMQLLAQLLHTELYHKAQSGSLYIESIVTALTMLLIENHSNLQGGPRTHQPRGRLGSRKLKQINELMLSHIETGLSLETMANNVNLSTYHFSRLFKASMGNSPGRHFLNLRLEHAKHLLIHNPEYQIATVSHRSGFTDQAYLCRQFHRYFGITPTQMRSRHSST